MAKIFLIKPKEDILELLKTDPEGRWYSFYTCSHGVVVCAEDENEARILADNEIDQYHLPLESKYFNCIELNSDIPCPSIIHSSGGTG